MPIREFRCAKCGYEFENLILGSRDLRTQECPRCGGRELVPLFSVFGVSGAEKKVSSGRSCSACSTHNCSSCN